MRANNVLGIIYSNSFDSALPELTNLRTMGSVPFGGRYRLIDFSLSGMVNCGISKIGVITKSNYRSLMDHLGTGKAWDLSRKTEGMFLLPPFSAAGAGGNENRMEALRGNMEFLENSKEEYVVIADSNVVCNLDYKALLAAHSQSKADITIAYKHGATPGLDVMRFDFNENGRIIAARVSNVAGEEKDYSLNIYVMRKSLLERLIRENVSLNLLDFERDLILRNLKDLNIVGYGVQQYAKHIYSLQSYYEISMDLLKRENAREIFAKGYPIYTKVQDDMPAIYGLGAKVKNSLIAEGCQIEGEVENCILFRNVKICKGVKVSNSIIMQGSYIGEGSSIHCTIMDKAAVIKPGKTLSGAENYPIYVGKKIVV